MTGKSYKDWRHIVDTLVAESGNLRAQQREVARKLKIARVSLARAKAKSAAESGNTRVSAEDDDLDDFGKFMRDYYKL